LRIIICHRAPLSEGITESAMKSIFAAVVLMVVALGLEACKDFPGADGRYATHDRGALNRYALTSKSSGPRCRDGGRAVSDREGRELDRSKGAGETHDKECDPGHYVDLADDGKVMGILPLDRLPVTREEYDTQLRSGGSTQYQAGYLPYSIVDGWQQIRKDFAYWRAVVKGAETAVPPEERAWFEADRRLREKLTLRDIGIWSHYVADASQPLHVSVHFNGWGKFRTRRATPTGRYTPTSRASSCGRTSSAPPSWRLSPPTPRSRHPPPIPRTRSA